MKNKIKQLQTTNYSRQTSKGFAIVEVLISMVVALLLVSIFGSLTVYATKMNRMNRSQLQGTLYLREAIESVKDIEQYKGWSAVNVCSECHPEIVGGEWKIVLSKETLEGKYERFVTIEEVQAGVKKRVSAAVSWDNGFFNQNLALETYVYND